MTENTSPPEEHVESTAAASEDVSTTPEKTVQDASEPKEHLDAFAELQAILAGLPMHAVPPPVFSRGCGPSIGGACGGDRKSPTPVDDEACIHRVRGALQQACLDYPNRADELRRLSVVHASLDLVCFADHYKGQLFTAIRGTDRMLNPLTTPRDWNNDVLILLGMPPCRTSKALCEYRNVRDQFPMYFSYGTGHSLGGNIVEHVALYIEAESPYRFCRIDVFNTGASPLRPQSQLTITELHAHRVPGDWVSLYYKAPAGYLAKQHTWKRKEHLRSAHSLGHFLPEKASSSTAQASPASSAETTGGEDGDVDEDDDDEEEEEDRRQVQIRHPRPHQPANNMPLWMSVLSCAGFRKPRSVDGPVPRPSLCLEDSQSEDRWRNCETPSRRPTGPSEDLSLLSGEDCRATSASSSFPLLLPLARAEEEDEDEDAMPQRFAEDAASLAGIRGRLSAALDASLLSGELAEAAAQLAALQGSETGGDKVTESQGEKALVEDATSVGQIEEDRNDEPGPYMAVPEHDMDSSVVDM